MMMERPKMVEKPQQGTVSSDVVVEQSPPPSFDTVSNSFKKDGVSAAATRPTTVASSATGRTTAVGRNRALLERVRAAQERARLAQQKAREEEQRRLEEEEDRLRKEKEEEEQRPESSPPSFEQLMLGSNEGKMIEEESDRFMEELEHDLTTTVAEEKNVEEEDVDAPSAPPIGLQPGREDMIGEDFSSLYQTMTVAAEATTTTTTTNTTAVKENPYNLNGLPPTFDEYEASSSTHEEEVTSTTTSPYERDAYGNIITSEEHARIQEEQLKIMEQIQRTQQQKKKKHAAAAHHSVATAVDSSSQSSRGGNVNTISDNAAPSASRRTRTIKLGSGETVKVHDQTNTRKAIQEGRALLIECLACQKWMRISPTAKLMLCPSCKNVVPVLKENIATCREEANRITEDRKLAELLQKEEGGASGHGEEDRKMPAAVASPSSSSLQPSSSASSSSIFGSFVPSMFGPAEETNENDGGTEELQSPLLDSPSTRRSSKPAAEADKSNGGSLFSYVSNMASSAIWGEDTSSSGRTNDVEEVSFLAVPNVGRSSSSSSAPSCGSTGGAHMGGYTPPVLALESAREAAAQA